jgi:hypothetical protein
MMTHTLTPGEVAAQAQAWRAALAEVAVTRQDIGLLRRIEAGLAVGVAVAARAGYADSLR